MRETPSRKTGCIKPPELTVDPVSHKRQTSVGNATKPALQWRTTVFLWRPALLLFLKDKTFQDVRRSQTRFRPSKTTEQTQMSDALLMASRFTVPNLDVMTWQIACPAMLGSVRLFARHTGSIETYGVAGSCGSFPRSQLQLTAAGIVKQHGRRPEARKLYEYASFRFALESIMCIINELHGQL